MVFVDAECRIKHFRHLVLCPYETEPESEKHLEMKKYLFNQYKNEGAVLEHRIGEKIADVFIPNLNGGTVFECQCSSITIEEMDERKENAERNGAKLIWIWGEGPELHNDEWYVPKYKLTQAMQNSLDEPFERGQLYYYDEERESGFFLRYFTKHKYRQTIFWGRKEKKVF